METRNYVEKLFPAKSYNKILRVTNKMSLQPQLIKINDYDNQEVIKVKNIKSAGPLFVA